MAPAGFECSLRVSGTSSASWATCISPQTYTTLSSAIYYFSVRAKGGYTLFIVSSFWPMQSRLRTRHATMTHAQFNSTGELGNAATYKRSWPWQPGSGRETDCLCSPVHDGERGS